MSCHRRSQTKSITCHSRSNHTVQGGVHKYALANIVANFKHRTFVRGVEILHWNGVPIARAVEISGEQHAGSNRDARHARGVAGLTIRPLATSLPPNSRWVDVGYRTSGRNHREVRVNWRRLKLDPIDATAASGADYARATTIGLDLELDLVRRANKKLFVPEIAKRQKQRRLKSFPFPELAAARRATDRTARHAAKRGKSTPSGWAHHFPAASFSASGRAGGRRRATARALASGSSFPSDDFPPGTFPPDNFPTNGFPTDPFPGGGFPLGAWPNQRKDSDCWRYL